MYRFAQDVDDRALRINPVVECNYRCEYCAVGLEIPRMLRAPLERWVEGFDRVPAGRFDVVSISGGEPLLLKQLPEFVNAAARHWPVRVYTNLSLSIDRVLSGLKQPITWRATVHPEADVPSFIRRLNQVRDAGHAATVVAVRGMGVEAAVEELGRSGYLAVWDDDLWGRNEKTQGRRPGMVDCTNHIWLFGPDGRRYPCVRHLMTPEHPGSLFWEVDWSNEGRAITTRCSRFGDCLSCDGLIRSEVVTV